MTRAGTPGWLCARAGDPVNAARDSLDAGAGAALSLLLVRIVKSRRRRGRTRISAKNQATIPVAALRGAGLAPGDELRVEAAGAGRIVLTRVGETLARYAGRLTGVYPKGTLKKLRREWR
jgi:bifunctional DNA-binding transcriptional regulator/antitoxin component of YhaV-PrlF toxin-antitoxin module